MNFSNEKQPGKNLTGFIVVLIFHILVGWALVAGLGTRIVTTVTEAVETKLIEETAPPPPPETPPPPPPPEMKAPPPPFIPPPEVRVAQPPPQQNVIAAVSNVQPDNPVMPAPRAVVAEAPPAPAAPPAPPLKVAAVVDANACEKPAYPRNSQRAGEEGVVTVAFLIGVDGAVLEARVDKSSGFKDLDRAAVSGLSLCKFKPGTVDGKPEQSRTKMQYVWKLE